MASRWRIWDRDFATEVLENNLPVETMKIMPVGGRGRVKLNIPPNLLNLPILSSRDKALPVSGRGRSLIGLKQTVPVPHLQTECQVSNRSQQKEKTEESLKEFAHRMSKSRLQNEREWPSLGKAKQTGQSKNNGTKKKTPGCETIHNEENMDPGTNSLPTFNNQNNNTLINGTLKRPTSVVSCQFEDCDENFVDLEAEDCLAVTNITSENICSCTGSDLLSDAQNLLLEHISLTGDYTNEAFLKTLDEPEKYILIHNVPLDVNEDTFQETISSFGNILVFLLQITKKRTEKVALVKMDTSSHCDWVISCLDGSTELSDERLLVQKVKNLIEEENE